MRPVELFHVGPQKAATTFVYRCLREHPGVACPSNDTIHYFDMYYHLGVDWYATFFEHAAPDQSLFDPTYTYIRSPWAPRRIANHNPDARIVVCLRHPLERAYSHYWHEKSKGRYRFEFDEVLDNYDLFSSWIEPGFYAEHIQRYLRHFSKDQILCIRFDELQKSSRSFLRKILDFAGLDSAIMPDFMDRKINPARPRSTVPRRFWLKVRSLFQSSGYSEMAEMIEDLPPVRRIVADRKEYRRGPKPEVYRQLEELVEPEIQRLEELLDENFDEWRMPPSSWCRAR